MDDSSEAATKADLRELAEQLRSEFQHGFDDLRSEFQHGFDDLKEAFRDSQTELLKAFYSFAEGSNKRMTELDGNEPAIRSRLATLEDRLLKVEKRLNMPPAA